MARQTFENTLEVLLKNYENRNHISNEEAVLESINHCTLWSEQLQEIMKVFKDETMHFKVLSRVASKIRDVHNRLALFNTTTTLSAYIKQ